MPKKSAGILPYRSKDGRLEVLLVHPGGPFWAKKDLGSWSIAKGEYEEGEDPLQAALREFLEETGPQPAGRVEGHAHAGRGAGGDQVTGQRGRFYRLHSESSLEASVLMPGLPRMIGILQNSSRIPSAWSGQKDLGEFRRFRRWIALSGSKYRKPHGAFFRGSAASLTSCTKNSRQVHEQLPILNATFHIVAAGRPYYSRETNS